MDQEQYSILVARLEEFARRNPAGYKLRVAALALLGYLYIFLVVVILLGLILFVVLYGFINFLTIKILLILGALILIALRSLWVKIPVPDGYEIKSVEAPELFDLIAEAAKTLDAPRVHHILLSGDFNAGIIQVPRLGVLGWQRNYLVLGWPLMNALSSDEFRAVLAHELGHLSGNHGRFASWIYRVRQTWIQLLVNLQREKRRGAFIFERFLDWYAPYFTAYSFVLARSHEYEADRSAIEIAGREHAASALINLEVKGRLLEEKLFPELFERAVREAAPPAAAYTQMYVALRSAVPVRETEQWLSDALRVRTSTDDTHPALAERLAAMGVVKEAKGGEAPALELTFNITEKEASAAEVYLSGVGAQSTSALERLWRERIAPGWRERFRRAGKARQTKQKLEAKAEREPLTIEERWTLAQCQAGIGDTEAARAQVEAILEAEPNHIGANFAMGQMLLEQGETAGIERIERAMEKEPQSVIAGCEAIFKFLRRQERDAEAERYRTRAIEHNELIKRAQDERRTIYPRDQFQPHGLSETGSKRCASS